MGVWWFAARGGARWSVVLGGGAAGLRGSGGVLRGGGRSSGCGQGLEASDALEQEAGPGVVGPVADEGAAGDGGGDVHQPGADRPGLPPSGAVAGQGEQLGPGEQVVGQGHDLAPDAVGREALQGEAVEAGVLGAADAVLAPGPQPVADFEVGELPGARVGGQGGEPVSAHVVEAQPRAGVGFFSAHDHPHALGPSGQVQHAGDLGDVRPLPGVAVGVVRGRPGGLGDLRVDLRRAVGELEPHRVGHPAAGEEPHGLLRAPGPVDAHQHFSAGSGSQSGLGQGPRDHLDVVGGGVRPRVARPQHDRRALTGPVGPVVEPGGQGVVAEPLLEGRGRPPLCLKWTPTRVASMSITNGRSALIPAGPDAPIVCQGW